MREQRSERVPKLIGAPVTEARTFANSMKHPTKVAWVGKRSDLCGKDHVEVLPSVPCEEALTGLEGSMVLEEIG